MCLALPLSPFSVKMEPRAKRAKEFGKYGSPRIDVDIICNRNWNLLLCVLFKQRTACHIQVFVLTIWLPVPLPVEYYEFARALQWSIPYFNLPCENGNVQPVMASFSHPPGPHSYLSKFHHLKNFRSEQPKEGNSNRPATVYGTPLTPVEYRMFFEVENHFSTTFLTPNGIWGIFCMIQWVECMQSQNMKPEAEYMDSQHLNG